MRPSSGFSKPPIIRSVVVLPHPEGPGRLKNSPRAMSRLMESTARTSSNRLVTSSRRTSTLYAPDPGGPMGQEPIGSPLRTLVAAAQRLSRLCDALYSLLVKVFTSAPDPSAQPVEPAGSVAGPVPSEPRGARTSADIIARPMTPPGDAWSG